LLPFGFDAGGRHAGDRHDDERLADRVHQHRPAQLRLCRVVTHVEAHEVAGCEHDEAEGEQPAAVDPLH